MQRSRERARVPERHRRDDRLLPLREVPPEKTLHDARDRQIDEHQGEADRRKPEVPRIERLALPGAAAELRPQVDDASDQPEAEDAEHDEVRVADDPVGEVDDALERQRRLERALEAGDEVEDHAGEEPADRQARARAARRVPRSVMKKLTMTVKTTISTAIVDITAPYCRYIGIGL